MGFLQDRIPIYIDNKQIGTCRAGSFGRGEDMDFKPLTETYSSILCRNCLRHCTPVNGSDWLCAACQSAKEEWESQP